jgi:Alpha-L-arabinofuranosidase C-terminal domain
MKTRTITIPTVFLAACALAAATAGLLVAQAAGETPLLKIDAAKPGPAVGLRYGMMTEEINFSYDGGLYAELVRNRAFKEDAKEPVHWSLVQLAGGLANVDAKGQAVTLSAGSHTDTNSIAEPTKIVPVTSSVDGLGTSFTRSFPPYSLTVLQLKAR